MEDIRNKKAKTDLMLDLDLNITPHFYNCVEIGIFPQAEIIYWKGLFAQ